MKCLANQDTFASRTERLNYLHVNGSDLGIGCLTEDTLTLIQRKAQFDKITNTSPDPRHYPHPMGVNRVAFECKDEELSNGVQVLSTGYLNASFFLALSSLDAAIFGLFVDEIKE